MANDEPAAASWFVDATDALGLNFRHDAGVADSFFMPQQVGSGAAVFDFDNDGRLDILLLQNAGPGSGKTNQLYWQLPDGRFQDVSAGSGLAVDGHNMGVAVGDVNNDGLPDVLITSYSGIKLFLNKGGGVFSDITRSAGLDNPSWATSAAFFDYDGDGWLDLVVANYLVYDSTFPCFNADGRRDFCAPKVFQGSVSRLFRNLGDKGDGVRFEDVTLASGLGQLSGPGLGVLCADFTGDGRPDIFITNDGKPNHLWVNQGNGKFKEEAAIRGVAVNAMGQAEANMGIALGDIDGDGLMDLFVTHLKSETNTFWKQETRGFFRDRTVASGLASPRWRGTGFGTVLADFDADGDLDIAIANGLIGMSMTREVNPEIGPFWSLYGDRSQLFANDGTGRFRDISEANAPFSGAYRVGRGLVCADIDNDGRLDLLMTAIGGRARLYRNVAPDPGHWLLVRALDPQLRRDALGAEVTVQAGGKRWQRLIDSNGGYLSATDPRAHFGLGGIQRYDAILVRWPDGQKERFAGGGVDRVVELRKGTGTATD